MVAPEIIGVLLKLVFLRVLLAVEMVATEVVAPAILTLVDHASGSAVR